MAKLSAHGTEVARLTTEQTYPDFHSETHVSFRTDGHLLRRIVIVTEGRRTDCGWKLWKKLSDPKRDTVRRMKSAAHAMSVRAEAAESLVNFKMEGGPYA